MPERFKENVHKHGGYHVPVTVRGSPVAGNGVFLDAAVPNGSLLWQFNATVGLVFGRTLAECVTVVDRLQLDVRERYYVEKHGYGYWGANGEGPWWRLANDGADFTNHQRPGPRLNVRVDEVPHIDKSYAAQHLAKGEELFEDYGSYVPVPVFVQQCFSKELPSPAQRCAQIQSFLPHIGLRLSCGRPTASTTC
eukprot:7321769-Prymnesium_polylepis.1